MGIDDFKSYLLDLLGLQESLDLMHRIFPSTEFQFISFHYCTYNSFRGLDIHFCTKESKKLTKNDINDNNIQFDCYTIDSNGKKTDIIEYDDDFWKEIYVSNVLRYLSKEMEIENLYKKINPLKVFDKCIESKEDENFFVDACKQLFSKSFNLGCQLLISRPTLHNNYMTYILLKYFTNSGRYNDAIIFFKGFNNDEELQSIFMEINRNNGNFNIDNVNYSVASLDLLISLAKSCLALKRYEEAYEYSKQAYTTYYEDWRAIYIYSLCNIFLGKCDDSIKAILDYPVVQLPITPDSFGISKPSSLIYPNSLSHNTSYIIEREIIEESSDYNLILNSNHTKVEKQIYKVLYLIYQTNGLEQLIFLTTENLKNKEEMDINYVNYLKKTELTESKSSSDFEELDDNIITFDEDDNKTSEFLFKSTTIQVFKQVLKRLIDNIQLYESIKIKSDLSIQEKVQLAILCKNLYKYEEAKECYVDLLSYGWTFRGCRECARIFFKEGNTEKSLVYLNRSMNYLISKHKDINVSIINSIMYNINLYYIRSI